MTSMTASPATASRSYGESQRLRRNLVEVHGIDSWRVTSTPNAELDRLLPMQLVLVPDVDDECAAVMVTERMPRIIDERWAETPDEAESTRYALERMRGNVTELRSVGLGVCMFGNDFGGAA